jgi:hypothetical protein
MAVQMNIRVCPGGGTFFTLLRNKDESGVSGTGVVLEGCVFSDGTTVVRWCTENADHTTTVFGIENGKSGWERFLDIHVQSHHNDVDMEFVNGSRKWRWHQTVDRKVRFEKLKERIVKDTDTLIALMEKGN